MLIAFNKPYGVLSRFTADRSHDRTLAEFGFPKRVYPIGRLDADSEGLLLLSDERGLNERLLHPRHAHQREYWAQVERIPAAGAFRLLGQGVVVQGRKALPCRAWMLEPQPEIPPRTPPVRLRKTVPTCRLGLELVEGKNRQVRRLTAALGHPTLSLVRVRIGRLPLGALPAGAWRKLTKPERDLVLGRKSVSGGSPQLRNSSPSPRPSLPGRGRPLARPPPNSRSSELPQTQPGGSLSLGRGPG